MARHKDKDWEFSDPINTIHECQLALLMDLRDELKSLNRIFRCTNFITIPFKIDQIRRNTAPKRKRKKKCLK